jgi:uncharacterized protein involved in type VI secretion and phage assembly
MADGHALLVEEFAQRVRNWPKLADLDEADCKRLAREAAEARKQGVRRRGHEAVIGPVSLRQLLGEDRLDTHRVALALGISRQAVHKKVKNHSLLGVPGRATTWFPAWQFEPHTPRVRPVVPGLLAAWIVAAGQETDLDPQAVLAWAATPQPELDNETPEDWVRLGRPDEPVPAAARPAARALAA